MTTPLLIALALVVCCLLFTACFQAAQRLNNYSIVDIAWSYAFTLLALFYASLAAGWAPRRWVMAALVAIWSVRLGTHLLVRVAGHHPEEDRRYIAMRARWAGDLPTKMFAFYQQQALSVVLLGLPFLLIAINPAPGFHPLEYAGGALVLLALAGESLADAQLAAFKRDPANRGRVCDAGLWSWSRHPNYFFEFVVWVGFFLCALGSPWGWLAIICPAGILYLLLRVTGVPLSEEQSLRSRGGAYRDYQRRVSTFFPRPPKP